MENDYIVPVVGMGATQICWSDRHAYTVIAVSANGKRCTVQRDKAIRIDSNGMSECQQYRFERDPEGYTVELKLRTKKGKKYWDGGGLYALDCRREYYDYSF